jgi:hypothetical protein
MKMSRSVVVTLLTFGLLTAGCARSPAEDLEGSGLATSVVTPTPEVAGTTTASSPPSIPAPTPEPTRETTTTSPVPTPSRTDTNSRVPRELVGTWVTFDSGNAKQMYVFAADGSYSFAGLLQQQRSSGMFTFSVSAEGTVTVSRTGLVLRPVRGVKSLRDPDSPSSNFDRPISTEPERQEWRISDGILSLTDDTGLTVQYRSE